MAAAHLDADHIAAVPDAAGEGGRDVIAVRVDNEIPNEIITNKVLGCARTLQVSIQRTCGASCFTSSVHAVVLTSKIFPSIVTLATNQESSSVATAMRRHCDTPTLCNPRWRCNHYVRGGVEAILCKLKLKRRVGES